MARRCWCWGRRRGRRADPRPRGQARVARRRTAGRRRPQAGPPDPRRVRARAARRYAARRGAIRASPTPSSPCRRCRTPCGAQAVRLATEAGLKVMTVPSFDDIASGKVTFSQLRQVELDDLLGRDPVVLDSAGLCELSVREDACWSPAPAGRSASELCRQIARFHPARLILFELSEFALYQIEQEFRSDHPQLPIVCAVGDTRNVRRVDSDPARIPAAGGVPRRRLQARAADGGGQRLGGDPEQRPRHAYRSPRPPPATAWRSSC